MKGLYIFLGILLLLVLVGGCGYNGVDSLPLPGGAGGGSGSYTVTTTFADAGNLVPRESCRTNDVSVGTITSISVTPDLQAKVVCRLGSSVHLPANADLARAKDISDLPEPVGTLS